MSETEKKYLVLPFSPIDLVEIYSNEEKLLLVDLEKSKLNIPVKQLLVYIANTKFDVEFNDITDELLVEYMTTNFTVKSPQLDEIITGCIHGVYDIPCISEQVADIKKILKSIPNYVLDNVELYSDGSITGDKPDFVYIDTPLSIGFNAVKFIRSCQLLMIDMIKNEPVSEAIYTYYMNNKPKYDGNDFYFYLHANNYMPTVFMIIQHLVKENTDD